MRICVIFNPAARGEKSRRFREHLAELSSECTLKSTSAAGAGRALAAAAVREGFEIIVAAGGDGTVNEVLNGIGGEPDGFTRTRLGVLPLGTINVFARELQLPTNFAEAWRIIKAGRDQTIDVPRASYVVSGRPQSRCFAQMAGAGLDSRAIDLVDWEQKKKIGGLAYVIASLKALRGPQPQIVASDGQQTLAGELVLVGNGQLYGGNYRIFPKADLTDGLLEVSIFPKVNWLGFLRCGWGLLCDRLYTFGGARHFKTATLSLSCASPMPFHLEGENVGHLPASFSVCPRSLRVITP